MKKKPYIIAFFFFIIDFISKQIVINTMVEGHSIKIIDNFFYLTYVRNTGAAWSILRDQRILLLIATVIGLYLINQIMNKETLSNLENIIYGMLIGGIIGNLFDRIYTSAVIDFLDFKIFCYDFPVFNLADTFIVIGFIIIIIFYIRKEHYGKNSSRRRKYQN